jgi:hypothetical protein
MGQYVGKSAIPERGVLIPTRFGWSDFYALSLMAKGEEPRTTVD